MGRSGGLANVAGAVLCVESSEPGAVARIADLISRICEDVLVVGHLNLPEAAGRPVPATSGTPLGLLVAALAASDAQRLLVVDAAGRAPSPALLLGLTAWPESDAVLPGSATDAPMCAIYRRESVLARARERLAVGDHDAKALFEAIDVTAIAGRDLEAITGSR